MAANAMARAVVKIDSAFPSSLRYLGYSYMFNSKVKFARTAGIKILELNPSKAVVTIENRTKVQNHIGGVHACGMALASETATGVVVAMNVPDSHVMVIKSMKVEFKKRAVGNLTAVATLTPQQVEEVRSTDKGDTVVDVVVTDEEGKRPIECEMVWAWIPKRRVPQPATTTVAAAEAVVAAGGGAAPAAGAGGGGGGAGAEHAKA